MKVLWILLIFFAAFASAVAQDIKIVTGEYPPYSVENSKGQGIVSELIRAVAQQIGWKVDILFYPWKRDEALIGSGQAWATYPYVKTPERERDYYFSDPLGESRNLLFYNADRYPTPPVWTSLADLKPYSIGGVLGYWYEKMFAAAGLRIEYVENDDINLEKLADGRIDLVACSDVEAYAILKRSFPKAHIVALAKPLIDFVPYMLMVSKSYPNSQELLAEFNKGLAMVRKKGIEKQIYLRNGIPPPP